VGRVLVAVGVLGIVLSLLGTVVCLRVVASLDGAMGESTRLTADALDAVDASVAVTDRVVGSLAEALASTEVTLGEVAAGVGDTVTVLDATATLLEAQVAGSLQAVEDALPALVDVAAVIDRTLSAASAVPFGPDYDPAEPFDDSLRSLQEELDGLPEALREQAVLVRDASASLVGVQRGAEAIVGDVAELEEAMREASDLLAGYAATADDARAVVEGTTDDLDGDLRLARVLVVALLLTMAAANLAPLAVGWLLLHPDPPLPAT
jgi:hypothetical protein